MRISDKKAILLVYEQNGVEYSFIDQTSVDNQRTKYAVHAEHAFPAKSAKVPQKRGKRTDFTESA